MPSYPLEGVSQAEIGLDKVVVTQIWEVITKFAENPDMGSKAILESSTKVTQHPVTKTQASIRAYPIVPRE